MDAPWKLICIVLALVIFAIGAFSPAGRRLLRITRRLFAPDCFSGRSRCCCTKTISVGKCFIISQPYGPGPDRLSVHGSPLSFP